MPAPTVVGVGAADVATPWAPAIAGPVLAGDIVLILVEQVGGEASPASAGFVHVLGSPIVVDASTQLSVLWMRAAGGETSATVTGPSNHAATRAITIRGVKAGGNPWNVSPATAQESIADTSADWPSVTTTVDDCLIVLCIATGRDITSNANLGAVTNANLTSITEQMDDWTATGTGGGIGMVTGIKATAGAVGTSSAVMGSTDAKALMTIALQPVSVPPVVPLDMPVPA